MITYPMHMNLQIIYEETQISLSLRNCSFYPYASSTKSLENILTSFEL